MFFMFSSCVNCKVNLHDGVLTHTCKYAQLYI